MRVAVIGCGTGGPAVAALLARRSREQGRAWDVTIFERAPHLAPVGAGILLQPSGMRVLRELGVLERAVELGARVDSLLGTTREGKLVLNVAYADLAGLRKRRRDRRVHDAPDESDPPLDLFGLGVHRAMLMELLVGAAREAGVRIECGVDVVGIEGFVRPRLRTASGAMLGPFDLVIIASGARSALREATGLCVRSREYPYGALWFVAEDREGIYDYTLRQVYDGTHRMIGFLPSGCASSGAPRTVSLFWSVPLAALGSVRFAGLDAWKRDVRSLTRLADPILDQLIAPEQLIAAPYMDVVCQGASRGRVVLLGDAWHAMSPQLGQGANLALMDASVLARACVDADTVDAGVSLYESERRDNIAYYQWASRWLTPIFQSAHDAIAPFRDTLSAHIARVPTFRRLMLESLVGERRGLWS